MSVDHHDPPVQSETKLRLDLDHIPVGYQSLDEEGNLLDVNNTWCRLLGYAREEVLSRNFAEFLHPDDADCFRQHFSQSKASGEMHDIQLRLMHENGSVIYATFNRKIVCNEDGSFKQTHCTFSDISDLKHTEARLQESEKKYRTLFELAGNAVLLIDLADGSIADFNDQACVNLEYSREEFEQLTIFDIDTRESSDELQKHIATFIRDGSDQFETKHIAKNGTIRDVLVSAKLINLKGRNYSLSIFHDITERKLVEEALKDREERLRLAMSSAEMGTWRWNAVTDQDTLDANFNRLLGLKAEESTQPADDFVQLIHPEDRAAVKQELKRSIRERDVYLAEFRIVHPDGTEHWLRDRGLPFYDKQGRISYVTGAVIDITESKKTADTLEASEEKYRTITETSADAIYQLNSEGDMLYMNEAGARMYGYTRDEIENMNFAELIDEARLPEAVQFVERVLSGKSTQGEICVKHKNGHEFPVFFSMVPLERDGNIVGFTGISRDITEQKRYEEEALIIEKLRSVGVLAGGIAHDFNNILGGVLGNISLAMMEANPASNMYNLLELAEKATIRAAELTQRLLTFSSGGAPIKMTTDISNIIEDCMLFALSGSNSKCIFNFAPELYSVEADPAQFSQVFQNLAINAKEAMPGGGIVKVFAESRDLSSDNNLKMPPGQYVHITVSDDGEGIPEDIIDKVFDPFFTTKFHSSGIGLATVYSIVNKHDGHIQVRSEIGQGTTFEIHIPACPRPDSTITKAANKLSQKGVSNAEQLNGRVLVMDDEIIISTLVTKSLNKAGFEVNCAENTPEAVEMFTSAKAEEKPFDLVILDLTIPGESGGKETVRLLQAIEPNLKAIVFSGYANDPVMSNFADYGFCDAIKKPFRADEIIRVAKQHVSTDKE